MTMIDDHGRISSMRSMPVSAFKATCLAVLERVRVTGEPVLITKRGVPIAEVVPPSRPAGPKRVLGGAPGKILGDIVAPVVDPDEWDALRDPDSMLTPR